MKKIADIYFETYKLPIGTKIKFVEEKQAYTVQASNVAFAICTKPFNARKTVLYTIINWNENVRGAENLIFGMSAETQQDCEKMLKRMTEGESEVSYRNRVSLKIEAIKLPPQPRKTSPPRRRIMVGENN